MTDALTRRTVVDDGLRLDCLTKELGGLTIVDRLSLRVEAGELVCLLGPSGCGKTTTLRMAGGFLTPDSGCIQIDGRQYAQEPPESRPTAMVFQDYALWPHMTVSQNVGFGLRMRKVPKADAAERVADALKMVNLTHHADSYPARISGGEQQRAALARALVARPKLLLLDEPLSNLDAKLRERVREEIREIQQRLAITTLFVTHDQDEALSVADRIAVMNKGRIEQYARPEELYGTPATLFVAEFVGALNRLDDVELRPGLLRVSTPGRGVAKLPFRSLAGSPEPGGSALTVGVRPEEVRLLPADCAEGAAATVVKVLTRGHFTELHVEVKSSGVRLRAYRGAGTGAVPAAGQHVRVVVERALVYRDGVLVTAQSTTAGAQASV